MHDRLAEFISGLDVGNNVRFVQLGEASASKSSSSLSAGPAEEIGTERKYVVKTFRCGLLKGCEPQPAHEAL